MAGCLHQLANAIVGIALEWTSKAIALYTISYKYFDAASQIFTRTAQKNIEITKTETRWHDTAAKLIERIFTNITASNSCDYKHMQTHIYSLVYLLSHTKLQSHVTQLKQNAVAL